MPTSPPLASDAPAGLEAAAGFDPPGPGPRDDGLAAVAGAAWADLREALAERARLLMLEVRLAGLSFVQLVFYAVLAAVLAVSAWIGLMAVLVAGAVHWWNVHWAVGVAVGVVLNVALAVWLVVGMLALLRRMDLQASLRRLQGRSSAGAQ